jgi:hypothetical protein
MRSIHISHVDVCVHFVHEQLDQFEVSVVGCEVKGSELLISGRIGPNRHSMGNRLLVFTERQIVLAPVLVKQLEASCVVFEGSERKG